MKNTNTTKQTEMKRAKITFSDGSYCYVEECGYGIKIDSITKIFNKEHKKIERDIDWDKEEISFKYRNGTVTYKGKIDGKTGRRTGLGKISYRSGNVYKGNFADGKRNRIGEYTWAKTGTTYVGNFKSGKLEGEGELIFANGETCKVTSEDGKSIIEYKDGSRYEGPIVRGEPTADGVFKSANGEYKYVGNFVNGRPEGEGKRIFLDKNGNTKKTEIGNFKNGKLEGKGKIVLASGSIYEGNFVNGLFNGNGTIIQPNGAKYRGNFVNGKFEGKGELIFADGRKYKGNFVNGLFDGNGIITYKNGETCKVTSKDGKSIIEYKDGSRYEGPIVRGEPTADGVFRGVVYNTNGTYHGTYSYKGNFVNGRPEGEGKRTSFDEHGNIEYTETGNFKNRELEGRGKITWASGDIYEGNFVNGVRTGGGRFTIANEETKKPLYTQVYNENGMMESVEYLFENEGNRYKMDVNYDEINKALNRNEIYKTEDLMKYVTLFDENGNKIKDKEKFNPELIKICAQYQMQTRLKGKSGKLNDENRMEGGLTGLENLIVLADLRNKINTLKNVRFEIEENNPDWPGNTYKNRESLLNSVGLTLHHPPKSDRLTSVTTLLKNNVRYVCRNATTTANNHAISITIDLQKIVNNEKDSIYAYDTSRIIDNPKEEGDLGRLQRKCRLYNHVQQELGSCWYNAACSTITAAEHPEIIDKIRKNEIISVKNSEIFVDSTTKFNDFELLQMLKLQEVAEHLGVERLGRKTQEQEFTKSGNRPRMVHQIINEETREGFKEWSNEYFKRHKYLRRLENKLGTYEAMLVICRDKGLIVSELGPKAKKLLTERAKKTIRIKSRRAAAQRNLLVRGA